MAEIRSGYVTAFFLFDVAEAIHLERVRGLIVPASEARFAPKSTTPAHVQYQQPPLSIEGDAVGAADVSGFRVRFKVFDYGVISVALTRALPSAWAELVRGALQWQEDPSLAAGAETRCR